MKNGFEIIDFHAHPFINEKSNVCFYKDALDSTNSFKNELKRAGIDRVCGSVIERIGEVDDFSQVRQYNDEALKLKEIYGDFYIPGIHIHPNFVDNSIEELRRVNSLGVKLVGELVPYMMGWQSYYDERLDAIYEEINRLGMVVSVHTQMEETMDIALEKFPDMIIVGAHPGDKETYFRHIERMKKYDNYFLDYSGTGIFRYGLIRHGVRVAGSERFLFGTDFPICNPNMYVEAVLFEKLNDKDYENIFSVNAKRLLDI